jgi:LysR family hydrogen peroxide-inducible transcriptional activator
MDLQQLRYLVAVADTGNFTRAAERCFVSQPSLSQQIINLEDELGHKLFHRLGRRAVPTEAGTAFIEKSRRILADVENAAREIRDDPELGRRIVVGTIPTVAPYLLPPLIQRCRVEYPKLVVHVREDFRSGLIRGVVDGDVDIAIVSLPVKDPQLSVDPLFTERLMLVVGREHRLAKAKTVEATDLANETFILLGDSSSLTSQVQRFCGDHNFEPKIGYRCSQVTTVKAMASLGLGISILPQVTRSGDDRDLLYRELSGRAPVREIAIVRHLQRYQSRGSEAFLRVLRSAVRSYRWGIPTENKPIAPTTGLKTSDPEADPPVSTETKSPAKKS